MELTARARDPIAGEGSRRAAEGRIVIAPVNFDPKSRSRLTRRDLPRFPGESLFARLARAVCEAECLPRKELFESWEVARRVRRRIRGHRVIELAAGHALVSYLLLLLDDTSEGAIAVDAKQVPSGGPLETTLVARWPRLEGRVERRVEDVSSVTLGPEDLVVSVHACGALSDVVIERAIRARARLALLPCCHDEDTCDTGDLLGFLPIPLAVDVTRVARLRAAGYDVFAQTIPEEITPHNRLILGLPR
jgi:hypothetical protein